MEEADLHASRARRIRIIYDVIIKPGVSLKVLECKILQDWYHEVLPPGVHKERFVYFKSSSQQ